jgi:hypothetical protein
MVGLVERPALPGHLLAPWALAWLGLLRAARVLAMEPGSLCEIRVESTNLSRRLIGILSPPHPPRRLALSGSFVCLGIRGSAGWHPGPGLFLGRIRVESTPSVTHLPDRRRRSRAFFLQGDKDDKGGRYGRLYAYEGHLALLPKYRTPTPTSSRRVKAVATRHPSRRFPCGQGQGNEMKITWGGLF